MQRAILGASADSDIAITSSNPWAVTLPVTRGTYIVLVAGIINVTSSGGSLRTAIASSATDDIYQAQMAVVAAALAPLMKAASSASANTLSSTVYSTTGFLPFSVNATLVVAQQSGTFTFTLDVTSGAATLPAGTSLGAWRIGS